MIKKIAILSTLLSSLLFGESDIPKQTGFFVGLDVSALNANVKYRKKGEIIITSNYSSTEDLTIPSLKIGYQYYFTKVYARVNSENNYKDKKRDRFTIKSQVFELNTDFTPIFYKGDEWRLRGVFGVGIGANKSNLEEYSDSLDSISATDPTTAILNKETQWNMEYGYQVGVMAELNFGLSAELGYRVRSGLLTAFTSADGGYEATFELQSAEMYLGVNYLF